MKRASNADEILAWLNAHAQRVEFQDLGARALRAKNRVVVSYRVGLGRYRRSSRARSQRRRD